MEVPLSLEHGIYYTGCPEVGVRFTLRVKECLYGRISIEQIFLCVLQELSSIQSGQWLPLHTHWCGRSHGSVNLTKVWLSAVLYLFLLVSAVAYPVPVVIHLPGCLSVLCKPKSPLILVPLSVMPHTGEKRYAEGEVSRSGKEGFCVFSFTEGKVRKTCLMSLCFFVCCYACLKVHR